jgi:hypothetical protein
MTSVEEFIATRVSIETLGGKIAQSVKDNAVQHSKQHLDEAIRQLETLRSMVCNDVQAIVEGRLSRLLAVLETKVNAKVAKLPAKKTGEKKPRAKAVRASSKTPVSTTE